MAEPIIGTDERVTLELPEPPTGRAYVLLEVSAGLRDELNALPPNELALFASPLEQLLEQRVRVVTPRPQPIRKVTLDNGGGPESEPGAG